MIHREEIDTKAAALETHAANVERDYVHGWVLKAISASPELAPRLILKGGNCLRKAYFENTRYSDDLDFACEGGLDQDLLGKGFSGVCDLVQASTGVVFDTDMMRVAEKEQSDSEVKAYDVRLYFRDFYGCRSSVKIKVRIDIRAFQKIYLPVQQRNLIHPYSDANECATQIRCLKLEEILASKLKCLIQRRHSADLYDYVFWLMFENVIEVNRAEVLSTLLQTTVFRPYPGALRGLLLELPFVVLKALWEKYLRCPRPGRINFDRAVERFQEHITELFVQFRGSQQSGPFFPAGLRNKILDAGHEFRLLKLRYGGVVRLVEPYALSYKQRKDGIAQEYLYAWDQTGGRESTAGLKSFVHSKIELLELTEQSFNPRYEVELSRAGERPKTSYFSRPLGGRTRSGVFRSFVGSHRNFAVECYVCGRAFRRTHRSSKLRPHKDEHGNKCFGRVGICSYEP